MTETESSGGADRRRFFRINDTIGVAYRQLTEEELASEIEGSEPTDPFLMLQGLNNTIASLMPEVAAAQPTVAQLLGALDQKLNCIVDQLELDSRLVQRIAHRIHEVNISACGIALVIDEPLNQGAVLALDLVLKPSDNHIITRGKVVACQLVDRSISADTPGIHYIRIDFMDMQSMEQELLIQHVVQRQGVQLQARQKEELLK